MCHYGEQNDVEAGSSGSGVFDDSHSSDPFNITGTKKASLEHLKRWRQAALVLNASRRFRYTLDLKKEEDKRQTLRKNRAHAQLIRAAYLFKAAGAQINGIQKPLPTSTGEFAIGQEQLASISREHNITALQQYGGVKGLSDLLKTNLEKGVYGDDTDLVKRRNAFGSNTYPRKKGRSFLDLTFIILMVAAWPSLALGIKYEGIKEGWYDGGSIAFAVILVIVVTVAACLRRARKKSSPDTKSPAFAMDEFLNNMEREKPKRLTFQEIRLATNDFSHKLGSGGFGEVYKGTLTTGTIVAVKVLRQSSDTRIDQQFMAEVGTTGRVHHFNLVRLHGFCHEKELIALVYEYVANGSLDKYLFQENKTIGFKKLHEIAVGTAKGIAYLHEECLQRIIHYDIKPANILLDENFCPKIADFGLAKLCNRDKSHMTMTGARGTPGYAAPELWMRHPVTYKVDVYSFGMLLFDVIGQRWNFHSNLPKSERCFAWLVWEKFDLGQLGELMIICGIKEKNREIAERMVKVALTCIQYMPESRPLMSDVVKMLEGAVEIPKPSNPF